MPPTEPVSSTTRVFDVHPPTGTPCTSFGFSRPVVVCGPDADIGPQSQYHRTARLRNARITSNTHCQGSNLFSLSSAQCKCRTTSHTYMYLFYDGHRGSRGDKSRWYESSLSCGCRGGVEFRRQKQMRAAQVKPIETPHTSFRIRVQHTVAQARGNVKGSTNCK